MSKWNRRSYGKERWRLVTQLMSRDGQCCSLCGLALDRSIRDCNDGGYITFDHVKPRSQGGLTERANLRLAHQLCNNERGSDPLVEEAANA